MAFLLPEKSTWLVCSARCRAAVRAANVASKVRLFAQQLLTISSHNDDEICTPGELLEIKARDAAARDRGRESSRPSLTRSYARVSRPARLSWEHAAVVRADALTERADWWWSETMKPTDAWRRAGVPSSACSLSLGNVSERGGAQRPSHANTHRQETSRTNVTTPWRNNVPRHQLISPFGSEPHCSTWRAKSLINAAFNV